MKKEISLLIRSILTVALIIGVYFETGILTALALLLITVAIETQNVLIARLTPGGGKKGRGGGQPPPERTPPAPGFDVGRPRPIKHPHIIRES